MGARQKFDAGELRCCSITIKQRVGVIPSSQLRCAGNASAFEQMARDVRCGDRDACRPNCDVLGIFLQGDHTQLSKSSIMRRSRR